MIVILLWFFKIVITIICFPVALIMVIADKAREKEQARLLAIEAAARELEELEALENKRRAELEKIERELAHLEVMREKLLQLDGTGTLKQQIALDEKLFRLDEKINKLLEKQSALER